MSQRIEIIVTPTGETRIETRGFVGDQCRQASEFIERALGKRTGEELTAEFHHQSQSEQVRQQTT